MSGVSFFKGLAIAAVATVVSAADSFALPYEPPSYAQHVFNLGALPGQTPDGKIGQISYDANGFNVPGLGFTAAYTGSGTIHLDDVSGGRADIYLGIDADYFGITSGCTGCLSAPVENADLRGNIFFDDAYVTFDANGNVTSLSGLLNPVDGIFANIATQFGIDVQGGRPIAAGSPLAFYLGVNANGAYEAIFSFLGEGGFFDPSYAFITNPELYDVQGQFRFGATRPPGANVPEPASMALLGIGLLGAAAKRRRSNQA